MGAPGAVTGAGSPAHTRTHRLAALLQRQDLGPQLGHLPPLLVVGLHPERQHVRQLGHLLAGLSWGDAGTEGQRWLARPLGTSLALPRPLSTPPFSWGGGLWVRRTSYSSLALHPNKCLLTDMEQGPG